MGVQLLEMDFAGPLNPDTVGLLIGRSSTTLRGLRVHPGIIDPDFMGQYTLPSINHEEPDRRYQWVAINSSNAGPQKDRKDPIWVPERLVRKVQPQLPDDEVDITAAAAAATPSPAESHGATLGDSVCIPEADADIA
ncbi:hypothetical protein STEG23_024182 [Scotinomys teguina]